MEWKELTKEQIEDLEADFEEEASKIINEAVFHDPDDHIRWEKDNLKRKQLEKIYDCKTEEEVKRLTCNYFTDDELAGWLSHFVDDFEFTQTPKEWQKYFLEGVRKEYCYEWISWWEDNTVPGGLRKVKREGQEIETERRELERKEKSLKKKKKELIAKSQS